MKSIEELQADLKQLYAELEERKQLEETAVSQALSFDEISSKAERVKIENHPMSVRDSHEQSMYLLLLLSVVVLDDTAYDKSISFLYRIAHGMNYNGNVQELFLQAQQMNFTRIDEITRLFLNNDIRLLLLMECMMLVQSFKKEHKKSMDYVANLCVLMKLEKEQISIISNIARAVLMLDVTEFNCKIQNHYNVFDCYLQQLEKNGNLAISVYTFSSRKIVAFSYSSFERMKFSKNEKGKYIYKFDMNNRYYHQSSDVTLFILKKEHECIYFRKQISTKSLKNGIPIAVSSNAPNLAYALGIRKYNEAGGCIK